MEEERNGGKISFWHYWHFGLTILCCGSCPVPCRMVSCIPGLYSSMPVAPLYPVTTIKNISRLPCVPWGATEERTTVLVVRLGFPGGDIFFPSVEGKKDWSVCSHRISCSSRRGLAEVQWFRALIRRQNGFPSWFHHLQAAQPLANNLFVLQFPYR